MFKAITRNENTAFYYGGEIAHELFLAHSRKQVFKNRAFCARMKREVERAINENGVKLLSFDVFDTVLLRNEKCELRRFLEMGAAFSDSLGKELGIGLDRYDAFVARILATKLSYRYSPSVKGCREGSLREIHEHLCQLLGAPATLTESTLALEIRYEIQALDPNPLVPILVEAAKTAGVPVVVISDMYMGSHDISHLLNYHFPETFDQQNIFSSGDLKISKRSGLLFDFVAERFALKGHQALHIGDNLTSDVLSARKRGWRALYLPHTDEELRILKEDELHLRAEFDEIGMSLDQFMDHG